jgi:hypothetical protein
MTGGIPARRADVRVMGGHHDPMALPSTMPSSGKQAAPPTFHILGAASENPNDASAQ